MCEHLIQLDRELKAMGIGETFRGQPWSHNCREWVYYDCVLDTEKLRQRFSLPDCVEFHINNDSRSGLEAGLVCSLCHDGVIGAHPDFSNRKMTVS